MDLAGSKLRKKRGAQMNEAASAPVASFAVAQLEKMGWTEGTGLGKKRNGISTHLKVKKRAENAGLGTEQQAKVDMQNEWWKDSLGDTLSKLSGKKRRKSKRSFTDEELFEATGGARFGMRAGKSRNQAKWRRTEGRNLLDTSESESKSQTTVAEKKERRKDKKHKRQQKLKIDES